MSLWFETPGHLTAMGVGWRCPGGALLRWPIASVTVTCGWLSDDRREVFEGDAHAGVNGFFSGDLVVAAA